MVETSNKAVIYSIIDTGWIDACHHYAANFGYEVVNRFHDLQEDGPTIDAMGFRRMLCFLLLEARPHAIITYSLESIAHDFADLRAVEQVIRIFHHELIFASDFLPI